MESLKELVLLADRLDRKGLNKEADFLDQIIQKMAAKKKSVKKEEKEDNEKAPKNKKKELDQDGDGDNDFRDVMMSRMKASGVKEEEAKKKTKKYDDKKESKS